MRHNADFENIPEADESEVERFVGNVARNDQIGAVGIFTDAETLKKYNDYVKDWRWRMSTFRALEKDQMCRPTRGVRGERCI